MEGQNFTRVPNEFLDQAAYSKLSMQCWQCLIFIMRQSWGWNRKTAELRIKDISKGTGLLPPNVIRALNRLENDKFIVVTAIDNKHAKRYRIDFKYELSRQPHEMLSTQITDITSTGNEHYLYGKQNVTSIGNNNSRNYTTDVHSHRPKEIKENIKKNKESAKPKEPKEDSLASLYKPMTEAKMQERAALLQKQAEIIKKANRPSEQVIIARLKAERRDAAEMPQFEICSVCDELKKMAWNTGGYLLCYDCGKEDWLEKVYASYESDKSD